MRALDWTQTGAIWPMEVSTSLKWYDFGALLHVIHEARIRLVVEIGVEHGGCAALLAAHGRFSGMAYRGIDITLAGLHPAVRDLPIYERDAWTPETVEQVARWMAEVDGPALLFCDGGNKPKELHLYAPLIRPGDVLMGHDYHNEYGDAALAPMPPNVTQVRADWLEPTLLCLFRHAGDV